MVKKRVKFTLKSIEYNEAKSMYHVSSKDIGIYIHVPFCKSICPFCPYYKVIYSDTIVKDWLKYLINEIEIVKNIVYEFSDVRVEWVYFGGGTPSVLSPEEFRVVIEAINNHFDVRGDIGIEANPLDLSVDYVSKLLDLGISKISIGVQSFNDKYLYMLRRSEAGKSREILRILNDIVREFNIHINVDILFSIPGQRIDDFINDVKTAINVGVNQVTIYPLILAKYLRMHKDIIEGRLPKQPSLAMELEMLRKGKELLEDHEYNISTIWSWSKSTNIYETVSNEMEGEYIGFGPGAFSLVGLREHMNIPSIKRWCYSLMNNKMLKYVNKLSREELLWRAFANNLYLSKINISYLKSKYGDTKNISKVLKVIKILRILRYIRKDNTLTWRGHKLSHILIKNFVREIPTEVTLQAMMQRGNTPLTTTLTHGNQLSQ